MFLFYSQKRFFFFFFLLSCTLCQVASFACAVNVFLGFNSLRHCKMQKYKSNKSCYELCIALCDLFFSSLCLSPTLGFSKEELAWLQNLRGVPHVIQTSLSPVLLYLTDLDQFLHHWDITEVIAHELPVLVVYWVPFVICY